MVRLSRLTRRWTLLLAVAAVLGCGLIGLVRWQRAPEVRLAAAERQWAARPFSHYRLSLTSGASCAIEIEVRDEHAINIVGQSTCGYPARTVTDIFELIKRARPIVQECTYFKCVCRQTIEVYALYDAQWGYPTRVAVWLQRTANVQHPDYWKYLLEFRRLPECTRTADAEIVQVLSLTPLP